MTKTKKHGMYKSINAELYLQMSTLHHVFGGVWSYFLKNKCVICVFKMGLNVCRKKNNSGHAQVNDVHTYMKNNENSQWL